MDHSHRTGSNSDKGSRNDVSERPARPCHRWANDGSCHYGANCRFAHDPIARGASGDAGSVSTSSSWRAGASSMARGSTVARGASGGAGSVSTSSSWRTGASRRTGTSGSTDSNAGNVSTASNRVASTCHRWANDGKCRFGESCRFAHDPAARATGAVPGATPTSSSRPIGASDRAGGGVGVATEASPGTGAAELTASVSCNN